MTEITKDWCLNMARAEEAAGDPEIGAGSLMPLSDINDLDEVCRELGIQDSHVTPAEAVRELNAEIERLSAKCKQTSDALTLLWAETVASGNADAKDYGWPKARAATLAALSRS